MIHTRCTFTFPHLFWGAVRERLHWRFAGRNHKIITRRCSLLCLCSNAVSTIRSVSRPPLPAHEKWNDLQQRLSHYRDIVAFLEFQCFPRTHTHTKAYLFTKLSWQFWPGAIFSTHNRQLGSPLQIICPQRKKPSWEERKLLQLSSIPSSCLVTGEGPVSRGKVKNVKNAQCFAQFSRSCPACSKVLSLC